LFLSKIPSPKLSTPALLLTTVRSLASVFDKALIKFSGIPHKPNPPTRSVDLDLISLTASSAELKISTNCGLASTTVGEPSRCKFLHLAIFY
jgi:hypothetical protein